MSRTRSNKKTFCYNPQCINEGAIADYDNPRCLLDPESSSKIFCSPECGEHYLENIDEIEKDTRNTVKYKKRKQRYIKELTEAIYHSSGKSFDKETIKKVIIDLGLSSLYV